LAGTFVEVHNLRKVFNGTVAVDGVNFTIERGEIFGLLGPNGAGKTTTIRMMSTTLPISAGDVLVGGHSVQNNPAAVRRLIGVCLFR
jgi:ABC-type multidrug transport system ATPase subunit